MRIRSSVVRCLAIIVLAYFCASSSIAQSYEFGDRCFYDATRDNNPKYRSPKFDNGLEGLKLLLEDRGGLAASNYEQNFEMISEYLTGLTSPNFAEKGLLANGYRNGCWGFPINESLAQHWVDQLSEDGFPFVIAYEFRNEWNEKGTVSKRDRTETLRKLERWDNDYMKRSAIALVEMFYRWSKLDPNPDTWIGDPNFEAACGFARSTLLNDPRIPDAHRIRTFCSAKDDPVLALAHTYAHDFLYQLGKPIDTIEFERLLKPSQVEEAKALYPSLIEAPSRFTSDIEHSESPPPSRGGVPRIAGTGSSFFISESLLVTNEHVVSHAQKVTVVFRGEEYQTEVLIVDESLDAAILEITNHPKEQTRCFVLSGAKTASIGDEVYAAGFPLSDLLSSDPKLTNGIVNSRNGLRGDPKYYQISAPIQPGNSGGPVFTAAGDLVGIATATLRDSNDVNFQSVNFALKPSAIQFLVGFLEEKPTCNQPFEPNKDGLTSLPTVMALVRNYQ